MSRRLVIGLIVFTLLYTWAATKAYRWVVTRERAYQQQQIPPKD